MDAAFAPDAELVARFAADLDALTESDTRVGVAVSGGPDSLALLLLTAAARTGQVEAATVDHRLRPEGAAEAAQVAKVCARLGVPHATLSAEWIEVPRANLQARAREERYRLLGEWAIRQGLDAVATAHHADDQAETLLMRLARGAGLSGLVATRRKRSLEREVQLVRPLLKWRRAELGPIVAAAGLKPVDDPANRDPRHDRSRFRGLLERAEWADAERLAASADWLAEADEALEWALTPLIADRLSGDSQALGVDAGGLPRELQRRLLLAAFDRMGARRPRGPDLDRARKALAAGRAVTLSGLKLEPGPPWLLTPAPPRTRRN